ncbi:MAG TPA: sialate O-acetylesterase, partial [Pelobium sp.]|nr:sialate O-acetylesterase [Pelobium sp.]
MPQRKSFISITLLIVVFLFTVKFGFTQPKLASIFTDNMVLQQEARVAIWGWNEAGKTVNIKTSWNNQNYSAKANNEGKWKTFIQTPKAGGPFEINITNGNNISLKNILIGEVWILGGQSNMEMPM